MSFPKCIPFKTTKSMSKSDMFVISRWVFSNSAAKIDKAFTVDVTMSEAQYRWRYKPLIINKFGRSVHGKKC